MVESFLKDRDANFLTEIQRARDQARSDDVGHTQKQLQSLEIFAERAWKLGVFPEARVYYHSTREVKKIPLMHGGYLLGGRYLPVYLYDKGKFYRADLLLDKVDGSSAINGDTMRKIDGSIDCPGLIVPTYNCIINAFDGAAPRETAKAQ